MSDFFSGIYRGIREPDVAMNRGPLPPENTSSGFPKGFDGTPDGRINQNGGSLLGSVSPYAYGEADRLSTQTAYLNIPHAAYRIIPPIQLPGPLGTPAEGADTFTLNHQLDDGDICFVIRAIYTPHEIILNKGKYARQGVLHAIDPVCNLSTVNYILHGLQRYGFDKANLHWHTLWVALGLDAHFHDGRQGSPQKGVRAGESLAESMTRVSTRLKVLDAERARDEVQNRQRVSDMVYLREARRMVAEYLIKEIIRPFGVPRGSERQGGQHQGVVNSTVTWPVDLVTSVLIDGKVINLVNIWRQYEMNSGDDLILFLDERGSNRYTLSHHPKSFRQQIFPKLRRWEIPRVLAPTREDNSLQRESKQRIWDILSTVHARLRVGIDTDANDILDPARPTVGNGGYVDGRIDGDEAGLKTVLAGQAADNIDWLLYHATSLEDLGELLTALRPQRGMEKNIANIGMAIVRALNLYRGSEKPEDRAVAFMDESIWQLVPGVTSSNAPGVCRAVWRHGYWHIARSQLMQFSYDGHLDIHSGEDAATSGKPLEATFEPVWQEPLEADIISGTTTYASTFSSAEDDPFVRRKRERNGTARPPFAVGPFEELIQGAEVLARRIERAANDDAILQNMLVVATGPGGADFAENLGAAGNAFMGVQLRNPRTTLDASQKQNRHNLMIHMAMLVFADELFRISEELERLRDTVGKRVPGTSFKVDQPGFVLEGTHVLNVRLMRAMGTIVPQLERLDAGPTVASIGTTRVRTNVLNVYNAAKTSIHDLAAFRRGTPMTMFGDILGTARGDARRAAHMLPPHTVYITGNAGAPAVAPVGGPVFPPGAAMPPAMPPRHPPVGGGTPPPPVAPPVAPHDALPAVQGNNEFVDPDAEANNAGALLHSKSTDPSSMFKNISESIQQGKKKGGSGKAAARSSFLEDDEEIELSAKATKKSKKQIPGGDL